MDFKGIIYCLQLLFSLVWLCPGLHCRNAESAVFLVSGTAFPEGGVAGEGIFAVTMCADVLTLACMQYKW